MKFYECQGVILNLEAVKIIQKSINKDLIKRSVNEETGEIEETISGKPYLITLDLGDGTVVNFTYGSFEERESNYTTLLDVFQARE